MTTNGCYYNTAYNIYIYPVTKVVPPSSYTVTDVPGATYGFEYDEATGYYVSKNKNKSSSYALCRVDIENPTGKLVTFNCVQSSEYNYDYGMLSLVNTTLNTSSTPDNNSFLKRNFKGTSSTSVQTVSYGNITDGFIYVKYRKDGGGNNGSDTFKFKVEFK
jgi:hypothetical protein